MDKGPSKSYKKFTNENGSFRETHTAAATMF